MFSSHKTWHVILQTNLARRHLMSKGSACNDSGELRLSATSWGATESTWRMMGRTQRLANWSALSWPSQRLSMRSCSGLLHSAFSAPASGCSMLCA